MFNRRKIIIILLFIAGLSFAQDKNYDKSVDIKTYELFKNKKYDEMIDIADSAFSKGIDFYYLRMRVGIAYYENKNYMSSIQHFKKALLMNKNDTIAMEYLYYSYLFSGLTNDANILAKEFPSSLKTKIDYKQPKFFKGIYTEGGYLYNGDYEKWKNKKISGNQQISGEQIIPKNGIYFNIDFIHSFDERITVFHGYINNTFNFTKRFEIQPNNFRNFDISISQNEYYINSSIYLGEGFTLSGSFHYLNVKTEDIIKQPSKNDFDKITQSFNDYVFSFELGKRISHFDFGIAAGFSRLNNAHQLQNSLSIVWYPFGNLNLYFVNNYIFHSNKDNGDKNYITRFLYFTKAGLKISDAVWVESNFTSGDIINYHENSAFIVYNNTEKIKYKYELTFLFPVSFNLELSLRYQFYPQEMTSTKYFSSSQNIKTTENIYIHKFIGGIKWLF